MEQANENKILIVDDIYQNAELLQIVLQRAKYFVKYVANGRQALEEVKNQNYDLILLDVMMPDLDGFDVCKVLKENSATEHIPIIFITASNDYEKVIKGFEHGGVDFINKPFKKEELLARVSTHVELKKVREKLQNRLRELENANKKIDTLNHQLEEKYLQEHSGRLETEKNLKSQKEKVDIYSEEYSLSVSYLNNMGEEIKNIDSQFNELFNRLDSGITIFEVDKETKDFFLYDMNRAAQSIFRLKKQDIEQKSIKEIVPSADRDQIQEIFTDVWKYGETRSYPFRQYTNGELVLWLENIIYFLPEDKIFVLTNDITYRKKNEAELESYRNNLETLVEKRTRELGNSELKFSRFIEHSADGMTLIDEQGIIIEWNEALANILDINRNEALGKYVWNVQYKRLGAHNYKYSREDLKKKFLNMLKTGQSPWMGKLSELKININNEPRYLQEVIFPVQTSQGYMLGGIFRNVTDIKSAIQRIETTEQINQFIIEQIPMPIILVSPQGPSITKINKAAREILKLNQNENVEFYKRAERLKIYNQNNQLTKSEELPLTRAILKGEVINNEIYIIKHTDCDIKIQVNASPLYNENGDIIAGISIFNANFQ